MPNDDDAYRPTAQHTHHDRARSRRVTPFAVIVELLVSLAGLAFVCLVLALFVLVARFAARRLLGKDDGSSLM